MQSILKPEFVNLLQLDVLGFENPKGVLLAFEAVQAELCMGTGFAPHETFNMGQHILQCVTVNGSPAINDQASIQLYNGLLAHVAQNRVPDSVLNFNYRSGHKMVESCTFENCNITAGGLTIPCFTHAALYLGSQLALSVLFVRVI